MTDRSAVAAAVLVAVAALLAPPVPTAAGVALVVVAAALRRPPLLAVALALLVGSRAHQQQEALAAPLPPQIDGVVTLVDDPQPQLYGERVIVRHEGRRYVAEVSTELSGLLRDVGVGDHLVVRGRVRPLDGAPAGWVRARHLAGRVSFTRLERGPPAAPWYAAANEVRRTLTAGSSSFDDERRPLYLGMVIGDDRALSELRQFRFRAAGLTHLTAVSGQNVAFVVAVAAPVLGRLGRRARVAATLGLLVALVLVTRADPSVLRAGVMAALAVVAVGSGRVAPAVRVLALTVTLLMLVDPMLVHSLGFRLSVAATAGLVLLSGPLEARLPGPAWLRRPLSVTLAAQLATAPLLLSLNGGLSPAAVPANLLVVPAAGAVMMLGVTVGMVAGLVTEPIATVLQVPARGLVLWIDSVAHATVSVPVAVLGPLRLVLLVGVVTLAVVVGGGTPRRAGSLGVRAALRIATLAVAVVICWPDPSASGRVEPAPGVHLVVDGCGAVATHLTGGSGTVDVLDALHRAGVRRVDVLVVDAGRSAARTATAVTDQWTVRRRIDRAAGTAGAWQVGGLVVSVDERSVRIQESGVACRLAR